LCSILQIALPVWKYTPVGPPVPIVKNSADFATPVKDKDATKINRALDRDVITFFIMISSISLFLLINSNSN
jgi:hypothetical protein